MSHDSLIVGKTFDALLFDVDCKDPTLGMSCPPKEFLDSDSLDAVVKLIGKQGMFSSQEIFVLLHIFGTVTLL